MQKRERARVSKLKPVYGTDYLKSLLVSHFGTIYDSAFGEAHKAVLAKYGVTLTSNATLGTVQYLQKRGAAYSIDRDGDQNGV